MNNQKAVKLYNEGRALQQQAKLSAAERAYRKAIKISPDFVEALNNLGNVLVDRERHKEAAGTYRKAQKLRPDHAMLLNNLGNALQLQGENEKAIEWFNRALAQDPDYADAYSNLGNALNGLNDLDKAIDSYRKAINIDPNNKEALNGLANVLVQKDEIDKAIESYKKVIEIDAGHKKAYTGLGNAFTKQDKLDQAVACYHKAIEIDPGHKAAHLGLGQVLIKQSKIDEAIISIRKALAIDPRNAEIHIELGYALGDQGNLDQAIAAYRKAIDIDPENGHAYRGLATTLSDFGEIEQAENAFRQAFQLNPDLSEVFRSLARNKKFSEYDDDMRTMEALYAKDEISEEQKMHLAFGLGKAYEDLKEYDKSIEFAIEANRLKWGSIDYSIEQEQDVFTNLKKIFTKEFFADRADLGNPDPTPIFVLGMIRSGTSLTEQIIASHPEVYGAGELTLLPRLASELCKTGPDDKLLDCLPAVAATDLQKTAAEYITCLREYSANARHITNKLPQNFVFVGLIKLLLPNAKIIHCKRDPMDNCLSVFKNYFASGQYYSYNMETLGQYYNLYADLMKHWETVLPGFVYHSQYEDLIANQEPESRKLLEFCGLPWDEACLSFHKTQRKVKTASNAQVRQPIYKDSVKLADRYGDKLKPLEDAIYGK
ncbi:MAG: tetratricopeptide repeat protein [Aestuariibacter sp.]|nr:tetratricopeptide repeat protein [Aestuariibacter sp.]